MYVRALPTLRVIPSLLALALVLVGCKEEAATTTTSDKVEVAECDEYLAKFAACVAKAPSDDRPAMEAGMKASKAAWKAAAAASDQDKDVLRRQCKTMLDSLATLPSCK